MIDESVMDKIIPIPEEEKRDIKNTEGTGRKGIYYK